MRYSVSDDLRLAEFMFNYSKEELAFELGIPRITLSRIKNNETYPTESTLAKIYDYFYKNGLKINEIKAGIYDEEMIEGKLLFHGAKNEIINEISTNYSKKHNDFGPAFYCAESYLQTSQFVSRFDKSSLYLIDFDSAGLKMMEFDISQEWMLAIAYFRGTLEKYKNAPLIIKIIKKIESVDYLIAPIADNRMFSIIDRFVLGEITDEQCLHCLSATKLGRQYVFLTSKAISKLKMLERCYISQSERNDNNLLRNKDLISGEEKIKEALIKYRGKGKYIEEIFDEKI